MKVSEPFAAVKGYVYGVGINDLEQTKVMIKGVKVICPFYLRWRDMIRRCYNVNYHIKQPTYIGCSVCEEWLTASNFKTWMLKQDWEGKELDKDLIQQGNKEYAPDKCLFVSAAINTLFLVSAASRGEYPLGVSVVKGKFKSVIRCDNKPIILGTYLTVEEAHKAWQEAKYSIIFNAAMKQVDERVKEALLFRCNKLSYDIINNLETKAL